MSVLTLVRHSQASFFAADYDRLSELGQTQAGLLGEHWVHRRLHFDEVYTGPRTRQRQTAEVVGGCYQRAGLAWPEAVTLEELDEYDLTGIMQRLAPALAERDPHFRDLKERYQCSEGRDERARSFQRLFEVLMRHWLAAESLGVEMETWPAFRTRVRRGLDHIQGRPGRGRRVVAFTSGGFIGTATHLALAAPDRTALELNWRLRNCSLSEFLFTGDILTLDSFNTVPHLPDSASWTYR